MIFFPANIINKRMLIVVLAVVIVVAVAKLFVQAIILIVDGAPW